MLNYLLKATVIVSVELAQGQRASGFNPLASKAFRKESQADKDPGRNDDNDIKFRLLREPMKTFLFIKHQFASYDVQQVIMQIMSQSEQLTL